MPKAILFDFDLTLVDLTAAIVECANHALRAMNFQTRTPSEVAQAIGLPVRDTFRVFTGLDDPRLADEFVKHWVVRADEVTLRLVTFYEPVSALLADLRRRDILTGIVSTRFRYRIEAIIAHNKLPHTFDIIVGGEDVASHKPDPEGLTLAIRKLGLDARDALYIGDHIVDARAAGFADVGFVGVLTGKSSRDSLEAHGARDVLDSLAQLPAWLDHPRAAGASGAASAPRG